MTRNKKDLGNNYFKSGWQPSAEFDEAWRLDVDSEAVIFGGQKAIGCRFDLACELQLDKEIEACKNEDSIEEVRRCMQAVEPSL